MEENKVQELTNTVTQLPEKLADIDRLSIELANSRKETALSEAKLALAKNEIAELNHRNLVLQIFQKYGLSANDSFNNDGTIIRGGALPQGQVK